MPQEMLGTSQVPGNCTCFLPQPGPESAMCDLSCETVSDHSQHTSTMFSQDVRQRVKRAASTLSRRFNPTQTHHDDASLLDSSGPGYAWGGQPHLLHGVAAALVDAGLRCWRHTGTTLLVLCITIFSQSGVHDAGAGKQSVKFVEFL